jgi:hypothetical protein
LKIYDEICTMLKTCRRKFSNYAGIVTLLTLVICAGAFVSKAPGQVNPSLEHSTASRAFVGAGHSHSPGAASNENMLLTFEEQAEDDEEKMGKHHPPAFTIAHLLHILWVTEKNKPSSISQTSQISISPIPLHARNSVYLI